MIKLAVMVIYLANYSARRADRDRIRRDVVRDDAPRADDRIVADRDARQNDHARAEPDIFANMYRKIELRDVRAAKLGRGVPRCFVFDL